MVNVIQFKENKYNKALTYGPSFEDLLKIDKKIKTMIFPTMQQVEKADHEQICRWCRFLPSPGQSAINRNDN